MGRAKQYTQACEQPRYGLMVQPKGIALWPGTRLSADLASTSWKVIPVDFGVCTLRTRLFKRASPMSDDGLVLSY